MFNVNGRLFVIVVSILFILSSTVPFFCVKFSWHSEKCRKFDFLHVLYFITNLFLFFFFCSCFSPGRTCGSFDNEIVMMNHVYKERFPKV